MTHNHVRDMAVRLRSITCGGRVSQRATIRTRNLTLALLFAWESPQQEMWCHAVSLRGPDDTRTVGQCTTPLESCGRELHGVTGNHADGLRGSERTRASEL